MANNKKILEKIVNILLDIVIAIFSVVLLISLYTGIQTKILKQDYADFFGYSLFEVQTGSMAGNAKDSINAGDWIIVKLTKNVELKDIITFKQDKNYITHRVVGKYKDTFITKGDANPTKDENPVNESQIVGIVVHVFAKLGILRKTLFNPFVLITLIVALFVCSLLFKKNESLIIKSKIKKILDKFKSIKESDNNCWDDLNNYKTVCDYDKYKNEKSKTESSSNGRVVTVSNSELENGTYNPSNNETISKEEILNLSNDELDDTEKTALYRVIPVNSSEIEETFLEIAQNEMNNNQMAVKKEIVKEVEEEEEEDKSLSVDLNLLRNSKANRKGQNLIDKIIDLKIDKIKEMLTILYPCEKLMVNESTIRDAFISAYIDVRYYNYYESIEYKYRSSNISSRVIRILKVIAKELKSNYHGSDTNYEDKVDKFLNLFTLISLLELGKDTIEDTKAKKEYYENEILEAVDCFDNKKITKIVDKIIKIQDNYDGVTEYFLKKLETNMFNLEINKISNKELYIINLEHEITFSRVYSDYIIDKTYNEGIVAEDKLEVALTLGLSVVIKDMLSANFNRKYIIHFTESLYEKDKKLSKILKMFDDEYAKKHILILVSYQEYLNNIKVIMKMKKIGYNFVILLDQEKEYSRKELSNLIIFEYVLIDSTSAFKNKVVELLPKELSDKVICDEIIENVSDLESE